MSESFTLFYKGVLAQWYPSKFEVDGVVYTHAEQYMMACKARLFEDQDALKLIMEARHPRQQQEIGRVVKNFDKKTWDVLAREIVYEGNYAKFTQNDEFKKVLLASKGTTLVEASPIDRIWGIGRDENDPLALDRKTWLGTNWLGEVLTKVREDIILDIKSENFEWSH